jgi:hypothetical protein
MHGARAAAFARFIPMHSVEPDPERRRAIWITVGQGSGNAAGIPFLAGNSTSLAADAGIEIDNQSKLLW